MNKNSFLKSIFFAFTIVFFAACDNDFNELGSDIIGINNYNLLSKPYQITAVNQPIGAVGSTNLKPNAFGIYDNPVFGKTIANFAAQVKLAVENPTIDPALHPEIESVILTVPYYATNLGTDANGDSTYVLDSIYGPTNPYSKMKLSVYESGYFMREINPVDQLGQVYFNDQNADFDNVKNPNRLNDDNVNSNEQNDNFVFNAKQTTVTTYAATGYDSDTNQIKEGVATVTKTAPAMKLNLNTQFFTDKIINAPAGKLLNNNVFVDYFRGIYFKIEQATGQEGNLAMLNFAAGNITINFKQDYSTANNTRDHKTVVLNFTGKTVSLVEQSDPYVTIPSDRLVLKGGAKNSMAIIDLFGPNELAELKANDWLINDAALTFTIDQSIMSNPDNPVKPLEPQRIYLYDLKNKIPLLDYSTDQSTNTNNPKFSKGLHDGIIKKDANGRGLTYKIRITNHLIRMMKLDSTNVRLGLVVTEDIATTSNVKVKTPVNDIKVIPAMSSVHPLGTVLHGSADPDVSKRPKFEIYYTKPKQD
jgi:hypothetical protein